MTSTLIVDGSPPGAGALSAVRHAFRTRIAPAAIYSILIVWFGLSQLLLWRFLGAFSAPVFVAAGAMLFALSVLVHRSVNALDLRGPTVGVFLFCLAVSLILFTLGGEGRFFYANIDWQVRDAIFRDISINPWPFVYTARAEPDILRGAIGMYLFPALFFKATGPAAGDIASLVQNSVLLAIVFALGSTLFESLRTRLIAFAVFVAFSGMDLLGQLIAERRLVEHLEWWAGIQYSSHITLLFWTPQYAIAGWLLATVFMLHQSGKAPLGVFFALAPLTALWSPLTMLGIIPFTAIAGFTAIFRRRITFSDFLVAGIASIICMPAFQYLGAANGSVGARFYSINAAIYVIFQLLETLPFLLPLAFFRARRFGRATFAALIIVLLAAPFIQIGYSTDFMMRAVIPSFAILAVMTTDALLESGFGASIRRAFLIVILMIGSLTGLFEIRRAFTDPPSPRGACTFFKAWDQSFAAYPKDSYLAPIDDTPAVIRPRNPAQVSSKEPEPCWDGDWRRPSGV